MAKPSAKVTIKKYANRRLYDTESSTYITLDRLAEPRRAAIAVRFPAGSEYERAADGNVWLLRLLRRPALLQRKHILRRLFHARRLAIDGLEVLHGIYLPIAQTGPRTTPGQKALKVVVLGGFMPFIAQ